MEKQDNILRRRYGSQAHKDGKQSIPEVREVSEHFKDIFLFGQYDVKIPFERLDSFEILQNIDLTYYLQKCRDFLKLLYDEKFKEDKSFMELRNFLLKDELNNNLVKSVFYRKVNADLPKFKNQDRQL